MWLTGLLDFYHPAMNLKSLDNHQIFISISYWSSLLFEPNGSQNYFPSIPNHYISCRVLGGTEGSWRSSFYRSNNNSKSWQLPLFEILFSVFSGIMKSVLRWSHWLMNGTNCKRVFYLGWWNLPSGNLLGHWMFLRVFREKHPLVCQSLQPTSLSLLGR